jgi:hypothetical protein
MKQRSIEPELAGRGMAGQAILKSLSIGIRPANPVRI